MVKAPYDAIGVRIGGMGENLPPLSHDVALRVAEAAMRGATTAIDLALDGNRIGAARGIVTPARARNGLRGPC